MLRLTPWASLLIVALVALIVRQVPGNVRLRGRAVAFARAFAHGPWLPLLLGVATGVATFWVWGVSLAIAVVAYWRDMAVRTGEEVPHGA